MLIASQPARLCSVLVFAGVALSVATIGAQREPPPKAPAPIERLGPNLLRVGNVRVDQERREISVSGVVTDAQSLEFIAVIKGGLKAYESALELDTNAINFNLGLILIGLDPAHATPPRFHFDPELPKGDPVEIWVEWTDAGQRRKVRGEELIFNGIANKTLTEGPWVYTGSVFVGPVNAYLADIEGPLIGFVHTPAPIIESPRPFSRADYGRIHLNPALNLKAGTQVTLSVRALTARP